MKKNNFKTGCLKYFLFAGAIIFVVAYMFTIAAPKSSQMAKEELIKTIFGVSVNKADTVSTLKQVNDTIVEEKSDTTVIVIPINITNKSSYITAKLNGVDMSFMIDTGCSDIQITSAEFYHMKHLGLITEKDIVDEVVCTYADNSKNTCPVIKIKSLEIGGIELKDISCIVQENADSSLLLGQNILKKLGEISIDYNSKQLKIKR